MKGTTDYAVTTGINGEYQANQDVWPQTAPVPHLNLTGITKKLRFHSFKAQLGADVSGTVLGTEELSSCVSVSQELFFLWPGLS